MKVEQKLTREIYGMLKDWWLGNNFQVVSPSMLPQTTFVCYNDSGIPIYSMCFYHTDSNLCWIGWQLKNPSEEVDTVGGLKYLFESVEDFARQQGYHMMFTTSNTPSVERVMKQQNYNVGDTNVNHYIKII